MIRFIIGLVMVMGAVGTLDIDPSASVMQQTFLAIIGLCIMWFGVDKIKESY